VVRLSPEQCRAARGLLDWPQARLGAKSNVSEGTIRDFEKARRIPAADKLDAIRSALERAGVLILADGETRDGGPGVRLVRAASSRPGGDGEAAIIANSEM
jgi:transcriptional regulator with XRE-family HTH domain